MTTQPGPSRKVAAIREMGRRMKAGEVCFRCHRAAPDQESAAFLEWESLGLENNEIVCPGCVTGGEQQAMDEDTMHLSEKVHENRLRRMADRQGIRLRKSRRRDPRAADYGRYFVSDLYTNALLCSEWGMDLDEVEQYLTS